MSLVLIEPCLKEIKRSLPIGIRLDPRNARILHRNTTPSICNGHRSPLSLLHCHRRRRQLQEQHTIRIFCIQLRYESPQYFIPSVHLLIAPTYCQTLSEYTDLIVDQGPPVVKGSVIGISRRCRDPREIEIVELAVKASIIGEAADLCSCIESVGRSVTGWWRIGFSSGAITDVRNRAGAIKSGDVAWARRYGTFVEG